MAQKTPPSKLSLDQIDDRFRDFFSNHGFEDFSHSLRRKLALHYMLVLKANPVLNMTRLEKIRDVALKHYVDCLLIDRFIDLSFPLIDLGTGAGFPGIPLQICHPDEPVYLLESVKKRIEFLSDARAKLELDSMKILGKKLSSDFEYPCQTAITRAIQLPPQEVLDHIKTSLPKNGKMIFMKGPNWEQDCKPVPEFRNPEAIEYMIPNTSFERALVVYEKK